MGDIEVSLNKQLWWLLPTKEHLGSCCGVMEATTRVRAAPSVADTDGNMMSGSSSALKPKPPPQDGALHPPSNFRSGAGTPGLDRDPQSLRAKPGSFRESGGMPDEGFQAVGSRLRAIRKRDRQDDLEPPSFSLGIGEASEMPSFDLGIDSEGEPDDLGARGLRGSKVPQRPGAVENRGTGGLGGQKGGEGEMGSGWGWGEGLGRHEELQHGEVPARASKESARPDQRALRAEGKQSTPDRVPLEAAAKSRNRLRKVSSGAPEREATGSKTPTPSLLAKATAAVARSPDEIAGAFADSDEEDQALLSIDFRSAGKSRASNGLTPIRKRGSESSQGLGLGGWKGAARESLGRGGVDRAKAAQTPEELEVRGSKDQITEEGSQRKQLDSALHRGNGKFASEIEKEVSGPKRSRGGAGVALDGLRTPPSGLMQKRNRLQKSPVVKRTHVDLSEGPEVPEGLANRSSGLDSRASLGASVEEKEGRRGQTKFAGRDFVPDSEDDEIEDVSSPEGKKASVGSINGKRRVTLGRAPLRQDRSQANQTTPRGHTSPTSTVPATGVLRSQRNGQKGGPILKHLEHLDGDETGTNPRPRDGEVLEGKTARNSSGQGTGGVSLNRKSSLASGLRKRKSDENGGGWSEWPAGAFGDPASDGAGRNEKENGNGFGDGSRFQTRNETQFGEGVSEEDCMGSKRPAQSELENGRKGGLADNPAAKAKGFSPSLIAREAKKGERWSGFGAAEDNRAGFVSFGTASERTYPSFGAAAGGLGTDLGTDLGSGRYGDRTYPPFAAATGSDEPGLGAGSERTYPQFGPGLRKDSPGEPSVEEREGFGGDSQGFEGFGEGFAGFGGASRGASGASADEGVAGFRGLRRPWSPPRPDFSSLEDEERSWRGGGFGSRAERGGGTEAGNGTERANGTERGRNGTETAHWMEATENGTERNGRGRSSWDEELEADGMRADGTGTGGTREGGTGADGSGASGSGAAEQDAVVRLLRERLPHYKPLDMLMREGGFDNEPIFIDYRNQFADIPAGGGGSSRSYGGKKASGGRRTAKSVGPVHTGSAQDKGHWTTIGGKKVYVNKTGKTLEGRAAYRSHLTDTGAQPKKKRRKARKKGASKQK